LFPALKGESLVASPVPRQVYASKASEWNGKTKGGACLVVKGTDAANGVGVHRLKAKQARHAEPDWQETRRRGGGSPTCELELLF
jgi:hypothetical protein